MGTVYRGVHPQIGKRVAIKVLAARHCKDQEFATRFLREAQVVNRIAHPSLVDIFSFGQTPEGHLYLVMELLEGEHLGARMERGPLPWGELLSIFCQILDAVHAAHEAGVIHRDLKPENIFLVHTHKVPGVADGLQVKVLDFGLAKVQGGELTHTGIALGTPRYMAPEQCRGRHIDPRADLYSVGLMLYEAVTGRFPFKAHSPLEMLTLQLMEPPPPPSQFAQMPPELEEVILRAVQKRPEERYASALEMAAALAEVAPPTARLDFRRLPPSSAPEAPPSAQTPDGMAHTQGAQISQIAYQPTPLVGVPVTGEAPQVIQGLPLPPPALAALTMRGPPPPLPRGMRVRTILGSSALVLIGVVLGASLQPLMGWLLRAGPGLSAPAAESIPAPVPAAQPALALLSPPPGTVTALPAPAPAPPPQTGALVVSCQTPEGEDGPVIRIDGRRRAEGCDVRIGDLAPGPHKVSVSGPVRLRKRVTIEAGAEVTLRAEPDSERAQKADQYQGRTARRAMRAGD
jgi:serine/threonine-protein kinase